MGVPMPKQPIIDYRTIADVLLTIEYTALNSFDYYQQVIQSPALTRPYSADMPSASVTNLLTSGMTCITPSKPQLQ
jgi:hypothetical protein